MNPHRWNEEMARVYYRKYLRLQKRFDGPLKRALEASAADASRLVRRLPDRTFSQRIRAAQYRLQYRAIVDITNGLWDNVASLTRRHLQEASRLGAQATVDIARTLSAAAAQSGTTQSTLLAEGFIRAAENSVDVLQSRFMNSIDLSPRVYKNQALAAGQVDTVINNGILLGKSAREIADDVRKLISARAPGGVSYSAMRLGRTELNNAFHTTQTRAYAEQPWVAGVKWHLSGSHPRSDTCDEYAHDDHEDLGAGVFSRGNVPGKPHPQCLCYVTAITVGRDEFITQLLAGRYNSFLYT